MGFCLNLQVPHSRWWSWLHSWSRIPRPLHSCPCPAHLPCSLSSALPLPQPFLVFGLLTTGLAVGAHNSGAAAAKAAELADAVSALF